MEAVFRGERPDQMAWFGDLTYWHAAHAAIGDLPAAWQGPAGRHAMHRDLGVGEYIPGTEAWQTIEGEGVACHTEVIDGRRRVEWITPVGSLVERWEYAPMSYSWGCVEHAVKSAADLRTVAYIYAHRRFVARPERIAELDAEYAAHGMGPAHFAAPATPISELNKHWIGVMELTFLMADEPELAAAALAAIEHAHDALYRIIAADPVGRYAMVCENLSATTMGSYFDRHIAPHLRRWSGWLHAAGKYMLVHNDGTLRGTIEKLAATGVDCVDAVTPKPVGDMDMEEARRLAGDEIILLGGLPGAMFAPPFTARDVEAHVRHLIAHHKAGGRFMFGVADQVPPNGDLALVRLVGQLVDELGRT